MTITEEQLELLARLSGIEIAAEYRPGVIRNLEVLVAQAALIFDPPLDALVEPAPVFNP